MLSRYRLAWLDRPTSRVLRRYEHTAPGELVHVDVKKRCRDPRWWRLAHPRRAIRHNRKRGHGYTFLHTPLDDHSRLAHTELLTDERKETAAAFWIRSNAYFSVCGIAIIQVLTDNGACFRSRDFAAALGQLTQKRTRPYRPETNGKVEGFHRTLADEWAYATAYGSNAERAAGYPNGYTAITVTAATPPSAVDSRYPRHQPVRALQLGPHDAGATLRCPRGGRDLRS